MSNALIGRELAGYRIEDLLGEGGMGVVYRATNPVLGRTAAIKLLGARHAENPIIRDRFMREPRSAAAINHPNIIAVYHADVVGGQPFLIMQYVDGPDLRKVISENGTLALANAISIVSQIAHALDAAHDSRLVHRDVKPENVLVEAATEQAFLTDFGLARDLIEGGGTVAGQFMGTPGYAAPEQIVGDLLSPAVDQYALGCVLFECLSGEPPFTGDTRERIMHRHLQDPPPSLWARRPDLPQALDAVITRAMAKDPGDRYPGCAAMIDAALAAIPAHQRPHIPPPAVWNPPRVATTVGNTIALLRRPGRRARAAVLARGGGRRAIALAAVLIAVAATATTLILGGEPGVPDRPPATKGGSLTIKTLDRVSFGQYLDRIDATRSDYPRAQLQQIGTLVGLDIKVAGYSDKRLPLRWRILDARTGDEVQQSQEDRYYIPHAREDNNSWPIWVPLPRGRDRQFFVEFELFDDRGATPLDQARTDRLTGA